MQALDPEFFEPRLGRSVSIEQAGTLLGVSRRTIYNRIRDGKLQTIRTIGGSQRVLVASLEENRRAIWAGTMRGHEPPAPRERVLEFVNRRVSA